MPASWITNVFHRYTTFQFWSEFCSPSVSMALLQMGCTQKHYIMSLNHRKNKKNETQMGGKRVSWTPTQLKLNKQQAVLVLAALHSGRGRNLGFSITDIWFNAFENNTGFVVRDLKNLNVRLIALVLVTGHARCYILMLERVWETATCAFTESGRHAKYSGHWTI